MEPYWGGAYYHPGYWGGYPLLRDRERERLRPLGRHDVLGHALVVRGRRRRRHDGERQLLQQPHGHVGHLQRRPAVQRVDRQRDARLRPDDERRRRRLRATSRAPATTTCTRASARPARASRARAPAAAPTTAPAPRPPDPRATRTSAAARPTTRRPARPTPGARRASATTTTPTSTATSTRTPADGWQQHSSSGWSSASGDIVVGRQGIAGAQRRRRQVRRLQRGEPDVAVTRGRRWLRRRRLRRRRSLRRRRLRWRRRWRLRGGGGGGFGGRFGGRRLRRRRVPRRGGRRSAVRPTRPRILRTDALRPHWRNVSVDARGPSRIAGG